MNLLILQDQDFINESLVEIGGRRHQHICAVLKSSQGTVISVGRLNGNMGKATIKQIAENKTTLEIIHLDQCPPPALPLTIILGLPRPRMLQRTLQTIATMGVQKLCLIQTSRVEKSFWQTPLLKPESIEEQLILGLEQGKATQIPTIEMHKRFRPFIEDELPQQCEGLNKIIAHPGEFSIATSVKQQKTSLAIGPEGGFIQKELEQFIALGYSPVQLGERILRVETAIPVLIAKLF